MAFFDGVKNFIKKFKEAAKAGSDFNPLLESVEKEIEQLHAEGKLDDVIYRAEQAYVEEHGEYQSKTGTTAADSKADVDALMHFLNTLSSDDNMPDDLKAKAKELVEMKDKMMSILGPLGKLV